MGRRFFGPVVSGGRGASVLLRNGGRLYLDVVSYPEYATPECGHALDLVVQDKAAERILEGLLVNGRRLSEEGTAGDISVFKSNAGRAGNSYGCQEDYLVAQRGGFGRLADILIPFLVTRQIICGAGAVVQTPRGAVYCLQPAGRADGEQRPIVCGHPVQAAYRYPRRAARRRCSSAAVRDGRRLPNMSETAHALLKAGATDLVLRMAEAAIVMPDLTPDNPVQAIGEVSRDIIGRSRIRLANGRAMSALEIQREYLARARNYDKRGADAVSGRVFGLWERALDAIGTGNRDTIAREIDGVIKYQLIERYRATHGLPLSAMRVAWADLGSITDVHRGQVCTTSCSAATR